MRYRFVKKHLVLAALLATNSVLAANFSIMPPKVYATQSTNRSTSTTTTTTTTAPTAPTASGPQVADTFRIVKTDGSTVIQQGNMTTNTAALAVLTVSENDALAKSGGRCAFNIKYDEISGIAANNTTNRLYSNDTLIAQNTMISLVPGVIKTIWTQPYLAAGLNTIRVMVNADSATPSMKWIRVNVTGTCGGTTPVTTTTTTAPTTTVPTSKPPTTTPAATAIPPAVVSYAPGSTEWTNLNNVLGYSNYATTQLKGKGYARYNELVALNTAVVAAVNAKTVTQGAYNSLVTSWNTFITDPDFKSLMAAVVPVTNGK